MPQKIELHIKKPEHVSRSRESRRATNEDPLYECLEKMFPLIDPGILEIATTAMIERRNGVRLPDWEIRLEAAMLGICNGSPYTSELLDVLYECQKCNCRKVRAEADRFYASILGKAIEREMLKYPTESHG